MMLYIFSIDEQLQAVLKNDGAACPYYEAYHTEELNENFQNVFTFTVPADHADAQYVTEGNLVAFKDLDQDWQLFEIKRVTDLHGDGLTRTAYCEHALYELLDDFIEDVRPTDCSAIFALTQALTGTRWSVGTVADLGLNSTNYYYHSALGAVQKVASVWGGELKFRVVVTGGVISARYVDLLIRRGADTGKQFEYGRHTQEIEREVDLTTVITAAYGRGKGVEVGDGYGRRLDFGAIVWTTPTNPADKPLNQEWVGDPDALAQWGRAGGTRHRFGTFEDSEETDPAVLLQKTWDYLQANKTPRATYRMTVMDMERLSGYSHEKVRLGDTTRGIDRIVKPALLVSVRVIGLTRNILQPEDTKITLGNFAPSLADDALTQRQINKVVSGAFSPTTGALATAWLDGIVNLLQNQLQATTTKFYTDANGAFIWEAIDGSGAMKIVGGVFALANAKIIDTQEWDWQTFGDGNGFTASMLNAGQIRTSLIQIFGNTEFYWDGDNLYIINPANLNEQIRLSKEGIKFTKDGGTTWNVAIGFDGILMEGKPSDPRVWYSPTGQKTYNQNGELVTHHGHYETLAAQTATFTRASVAYLSDGSQVASGVPRYEYMRQPAPVWQDTFDVDQLASQYTSGGDTAATWAVSGGVLTGTGGTQATLIKKDLLLQDCKIKITSDQAENGGVYARYQDNSNFYFLRIEDASGTQEPNTISIRKRVGGTITTIKTVSISWTRGVQKTFEFVLHGSRLEAWFDGVKVISEVDTAFTGGGVGLRSNGATAVSRYLDFTAYYAQQGVEAEEACTNIIATWPTGWTVSGDVGMAAVDQGVQPGAALNTVRLTNSGATTGTYSSPLFALSPSTKYTLRFKARGTVGADKFNAWVLSSTGTLAQGVTSPNPTGAFQAFTVTFTTTADITGTNQYIRFDHNGNDAGYIEIAEVELIQKAYPLTFPGYGATRAAEILTVPTANILSVTEGEVAIDVYIDPNGVHSASNPNYTIPFAVATIQPSPYAELNQISFRRSPSSQAWTVGFTNASGAGATVSLGNITTAGVYRITASWKSGVGGYAYLNGVPKGSVASTYLPSAFASTMYIGSWDGSNLPVNSPISNFRVRNQMRSDAEVLAEFNSGLPLTVDDATTYLTSCDGTLQPTVRKFGLYSASGEIVGNIIRGSTVFGSIVKSCDNIDDDTYVALIPPNTLRVVNNGQTALEIVAGGSNGVISFLDGGTEYLRANAAYSLSAVLHTVLMALNSRPLALVGPAGTGQVVKLNADGTVNIDATGEIRVKPGSGDYFVVDGNFGVTGLGKGCIVQTVDYGKRWLYAVEGPEIRLEDKGCGVLIDGQCRVDLKPKFLQTIEKDLSEAPWIIEPTPYFDSRLFVSEINSEEGYFIVRECGGGTSTGRFSWSISAVKIGCIGIYMPEFEAEGDILTSNWEDGLLL